MREIGLKCSFLVLVNPGAFKLASNAVNRLQVFLPLKGLWRRKVSEHDQ